MWKYYSKIHIRNKITKKNAARRKDLMSMVSPRNQIKYFRLDPSHSAYILTNRLQCRKDSEIHPRSLSYSFHSRTLMENF